MRRAITSSARDRMARCEDMVFCGECLCDVAGGEPIGFVLSQQPKHLKAGRLGKRGESENGLFRFHISRFIDILRPVNLNGRCACAPYFHISRNTVDGAGVV